MRKINKNMFILESWKDPSVHGLIEDTISKYFSDTNGCSVVIDLPFLDILPLGLLPNNLYSVEQLLTSDNGLSVDHKVSHLAANADDFEPSSLVDIAFVLHDMAILGNLKSVLHAWYANGGGPVIAVMGGHSESRRSDTYRDIAFLSRELSRGNALVVTEGGPGAMEAANLGSYMAPYPENELVEAIEILGSIEMQEDPIAASNVALKVREQYKVMHGFHKSIEARGGLGISSWQNSIGSTLPNAFMYAMAKLLRSATPEDLILDIAIGGTVFAAGRAGTTQEIFQAVTKSAYRVGGQRGPLCLYGVQYWSEVVPIVSAVKSLHAMNNIEPPVVSDDGKILTSHLLNSENSK